MELEMIINLHRRDISESFGSLVNEHMVLTLVAFMACSQLWKCRIGLIMLYSTVIMALLLGHGTHAGSSKNVMHIIRMAYWCPSQTGCLRQTVEKPRRQPGKTVPRSSLVWCKHWAVNCGIAGDTRNLLCVTISWSGDLNNQKPASQK